jgi:hypothetical protein
VYSTNGGDIAVHNRVGVMMAPARAVVIAALLALAADAQINDPQVPQVIVPATTVRTLTRAGDTTVRGATLLGCPRIARAVEKTQKKRSHPLPCLFDHPPSGSDSSVS